VPTPRSGQFALLFAAKDTGYSARRNPWADNGGYRVRLEFRFPTIGATYLLFERQVDVRTRMAVVVD
jgi:hypothetical protein